MIKRQFELVWEDVQKFGIVLHRVYARNPTGSVTPTQIHAMGCAIHMSRTDKMDYGFKDDIPREHWTNCDSFVVLQSPPKFSVTGTAGKHTGAIDGSCISGIPGEAETRTDSDPLNAMDVEVDMIQNDGRTRCGSGICSFGGNELRGGEGGGSSASSGMVGRGGSVLEEEGEDIAGSGGEKAVSKCLCSNWVQGSEECKVASATSAAAFCHGQKNSSLS